MARAPLKPVVWVGSSLDDLGGCPEEVQDVVGYALYLAQTGERHPAAKRLKGDLRGLVEVVADHASGTYRAVYMAKLANTIYVLHVFQRKSKSGIATPKPDMRLIEERLKQAAALAQARSG